MNTTFTISTTRIFKKFQEQLTSLWKSSNYFRIISIATTTISGSLLMRIILFKLYRKYYNLPNGPLKIQLGVFSMDFLESMGSNSNYGSAVSLMLGPKTAVIFNNPYLCKQIYSDSRTLETPNVFSSDLMFASTNGKPWKERRKIIFANLMSTMKASYVENATKKFIQTKVFPIFDETIKNNKMAPIKKLFRPIGFNIVLQACFGKELESLYDPLWLKWDEKNKILEKYTMIQLAIIFICGGNGKISDYIQNYLCGGTLVSQRIDEIDILDDISSNNKRNVLHKKDENVKLFDDYVDEYISDKNGTKWTRKQLLGDMTMMFFAATDTTYSALSFSLLLAAKYQNIQQEIHNELIIAFGNNPQNVELRNNGIRKIPKLRAFIQEVLRIFPPSPVAGFREMNNNGFTFDTNNFDKNGQKYNIPKGTQMMINVVGIHRNPKFWIKNYDPMNNKKHKNIDMNTVHLEFWLDDNGLFNKKKNSESFLTFSLGKRDCVGQSLAMKELMIVLAMIFIKYKIYGPNKNNEFEIKSKFNTGIFEPAIKGIRLTKRE